MRNLGPVVKVAALPVLDARQDLASGSAVAAQLVGHDHPWDILQAVQQFTEKPPSGTGVTPALDHDIEHLAVLVDRTPEVVQLADDADEHLVQVPLVAGSWTSPLQPVD